MTVRRKPRPRDPLQFAKLIGDIATGQVQDAEDDGRDPAMSELGRHGGLRVGRVRATTGKPCADKLALRRLMVGRSTNQN